MAGRGYEMWTVSLKRWRKFCPAEKIANQPPLLINDLGRLPPAVPSHWKRSNSDRQIGDNVRRDFDRGVPSWAKYCYSGQFDLPQYQK